MTAKMSGEAKLRSTDDSSGKNDAVAPTMSGGGRIEGLDGLRAFAVLAVLAFHLWPSTLPGGGGPRG